MLFNSDDTRRKVTLLAGLLFFLGMSQSLITSFMASNPNTENTAQAIDRAPIEQMDLEKGYTIVLEREPENQTALKGLVDARVAKENWAGVIPPLETLIALNPEDESYGSLREFVDEQLLALSETTSPSPTPLTESQPETP